MDMKKVKSLVDFITSKVYEADLENYRCPRCNKPMKSNESKPMCPECQVPVVKVDGGGAVQDKQMEVKPAKKVPEKKQPTPEVARPGTSGSTLHSMYHNIKDSVVIEGDKDPVQVPVDQKPHPFKFRECSKCGYKEPHDGNAAVEGLNCPSCKGAMKGTDEGIAPSIGVDDEATMIKKLTETTKYYISTVDGVEYVIEQYTTPDKEETVTVIFDNQDNEVYNNQDEANLKAAKINQEKVDAILKTMKPHELATEKKAKKIKLRTAKLIKIQDKAVKEGEEHEVEDIAGAPAVVNPPIGEPEAGAPAPEAGAEKEEVKDEFTIEDAKKAIEEMGVEPKEFGFKDSDLLAGMKVEDEEHNDVTEGDALKTAKIALAHLKEFPDYYDRLKKMEAEGKKDWEPKRKELEKEKEKKAKEEADKDAEKAKKEAEKEEKKAEKEEKKVGKEEAPEQKPEHELETEAKVAEAHKPGCDCGFCKKIAAAKAAKKEEPKVAEAKESGKEKKAAAERTKNALSLLRKIHKADTQGKLDDIMTSLEKDSVSGDIDSTQEGKLKSALDRRSKTLKDNPKAPETEPSKEEEKGVEAEESKETAPASEAKVQQDKVQEMVPVIVAVAPVKDKFVVMEVQANKPPRFISVWDTKPEAETEAKKYAESIKGRFDEGIMPSIGVDDEIEVIKKLTETMKILARGISDKIIADSIATTNKGRVLKDLDDAQKFMVVA